jgi:hypothetical protein
VVLIKAPGQDSSKWQGYSNKKCRENDGKGYAHRIHLMTARIDGQELSHLPSFSKLLDLDGNYRAVLDLLLHHLSSLRYAFSVYLLATIADNLIDRQDLIAAHLG